MMVSIIIPAWNGAAFLANCLDSLRNFIHDDYEVIVVDNASRDQTAAIAQHYAEVRLIENPINRGFSRAVNQGLQAAAGDILFLLNQDTVALGDWLTPIREQFAANDRVGIIGCQLVYPDGRVQHAGARLLEPSWGGQHLTQNDGTEAIDYVTGAAFAIRRECLADVGYFDESFFPAYSEDVDYCLRAKALGWQVVYEPRAMFTHFESQSRGDDLSFLITVNTQRLRLVLKHHDVIWLRDVFAPAESQVLIENLSCEWLLAMAHVYLRIACDVKQISGWRAVFYKDTVSLAMAHLAIATLFDLRAAAMSRALNLLAGEFVES
ncbi:MAG: glycosyltransferase family 2 protein [Anaerolineae bacterium]|nr:glycosyltransferase family 2 protein [Anaerolineae bacterium]